MNEKYMVTATFEEGNIKNNSNAASKLLIGREQIFYCGDNENIAKEKYNELPNKDKKLFLANVDFTIVNGKKIIKKWNEISVDKEEPKEKYDADVIEALKQFE